MNIPSTCIAIYTNVYRMIADPELNHIIRDVNKDENTDRLKVKMTLFLGVRMSNFLCRVSEIAKMIVGTISEDNVLVSPENKP